MGGLSRLLILGFGLVAIMGALTTRGVLFGEGNLQTALGIFVLVVGVVGVANTILFTRLKAQIDAMVEQEKSQNQEKL